MAYDIFGGGTIDGIARATISAHTLDTNNPHSVTKAQVGLSDVINIDTSTTANITDSLNKRLDRKSTRLNSSHSAKSRMPSSA